MKHPDAVLQEIWQIKDTAFDAVGRDSKLFVAQLRARSAQLCEGLALRPLNTKSQAPRIFVRDPATN